MIEFRKKDVSEGRDEALPKFSLSALQANYPEIFSIPPPKEILEAVEEMTSSIEGPGIELSSLVELIQVVLFLDRKNRR